MLGGPSAPPKARCAPALTWIGVELTLVEDPFQSRFPKVCLEKIRTSLRTFACPSSPPADVCGPSSVRSAQCPAFSFYRGPSSTSFGERCTPQLPQAHPNIASGSNRSSRHWSGDPLSSMAKAAPWYADSFGDHTSDGGMWCRLQRTSLLGAWEACYALADSPLH